MGTRAPFGVVTLRRGDTLAAVDDRAEFERLVDEAVEGIPEPFAGALGDVALLVESHARGRSLYGLYEGYPITAGSTPSLGMPPRITIYMHPMIEHFPQPEALRHQVRITVLHELGHHLGLGEERLGELGYA